MAPPEALTAQSPVRSTAQEFARAKSLSRKTLAPKSLQAWGMGCFFGQYDEYCLDVNEYRQAQILSPENNYGPITVKFELGEDFYIAAADLDNNGVEEVYILNGDEYVKFDLKDRIDFSQEWTKLPPTKAPYDRDHTRWGSSCNGRDWFKPDPPFSLYVENGALHITGMSERGAEHYIVTPTVYLEKREDGRLHNSWEKEDIIPVLQCAIDQPTINEQTQLRLRSAIQMLKKSQGMLEYQDGPLELKNVSFSFKYRDININIDTISPYTDSKGVISLKVGFFYGGDYPMFYVNRAGVLFSQGKFNNMNPLNTDQKKFIKAALNSYLENDGKLPQNADRAHNVKIILRALDTPPPAWAK